MQTNVVEMEEISKSAEGFCAAESRAGRGVVLLRTAAQKAEKNRWIESRSLWVEKNLNRVFVPVTLRDRFFWMDAITGTLYDQAGKCKSSDVLSIDVACLRNNFEKAQKMLLGAKSGECGVSERDSSGD